MDELGLNDQLACCRFEVSTLVQPLYDTSKWILLIVGGLEMPVIYLHVHVIDAGVIQVELMYKIQRNIGVITSVRIF